MQDDIRAVGHARVDCRDGAAAVQADRRVAARLKGSLRLRVLPDSRGGLFVDRGVPASDHCVYPAERSRRRRR